MKKRGLIWAVMALWLASTCGCALVAAGAAAGAGTYTYIKGELIRNYEAGYEASLAASKAAASDMRVNVTSVTDTGVSATIEGERPDGTPVTVKLESIGPKDTKIGVRVGYVGVWQRDVAEAFHQQILENL